MPILKARTPAFCAAGPPIKMLASTHSVADTLPARSPNLRQT
jgi:hypothetical protein